jgi:hypothetical protein
MEVASEWQWALTFDNYCKRGRGRGRVNDHGCLGNQLLEEPAFGPFGPLSWRYPFVCFAWSYAMR